MVKIEDKIKNERFQKRFRQSAEIALQKKGVAEEIEKIRELWGVPKNGFNGLQKKFILWFNEQTDDNFKKVTTTAETCYKHLEFNPRYFLIKIGFSLQDNEYPDSLYLLEDKETFNALRIEKPFPGIVHYILFNDIFIPETNELQLTTEDGGVCVVRMGPNATMDDFREMYPIISGLFQKGAKNFGKGTARFRKNHGKDLTLLQKKRSPYDHLDELGLDEKTSKKSLGNIRVRRKRMKGRIGN